MKEIKIKLCSCGSKGTLIRIRPNWFLFWKKDIWFVLCSSCGKNGLKTDTENKAIDMWNKRISNINKKDTRKCANILKFPNRR